MRFPALLAALVPLATLPSCAVTPVQPRVKVENPQTFDAPRDAVWGQVVSILADQGLPILSAEKDSGLISTGTIDIKGVSKVAEPLSMWESSRDSIFDEGRYRLTVLVQEVDATTTSVKLSPYIEAFSGGQYLHKESLGVVEASIFDKLRANLGGTSQTTAAPGTR